MKLFVQKLRYTAKFVADLQNVVAGGFEILGTPKRKGTGVWMQIKLSDGSIATVDTGQLAVLHNTNIEAGLPGVFTSTTAVEEGSEYELRADLKLGIMDGMMYAA